MSIELLLGEMPKARFTRDYLFRQPCSMTGTAAQLCSLGSLETLVEILAGDSPDVMIVRQNQRVEAAVPNGLREIEALLSAGATLLVRHAEQHHGAIAELAAGFASDFAAPVNVHLYATPPGQFGFSWHYDAEEVFIVQTAGRKEYLLRKNTVHPWPLEESLPLDMHYEREMMPLHKVELAAGDWLYIPGGWWHRAETRGEQTAISLAIGILPRTPIEVLDVLRRELVADIFWRQRLPIFGDARAGDTAALKDELRQILGTLARDLGRRMESDEFADRLLREFGEAKPMKKTAAADHH